MRNRLIDVTCLALGLIWMDDLTEWCGVVWGRCPQKRMLPAFVNTHTNEVKLATKFEVPTYTYSAGLDFGNCCALEGRFRTFTTIRHSTVTYSHCISGRPVRPVCRTSTR